MQTDRTAPGTDARVAAIIVTYQPDATLDQAVTAALEQVAHLWIVDNGSGPEVAAHLRELAARDPDRVSLMLNQENRGLPAAQNQAIEAALEAGYGWILLLDDDSVPASGMVSTMLTAVARRDEPERIALVAPRLFDLNLNRFREMYVSHGPWHVARRMCESDQEDLVYAIASGSLIRADAVRRVGLPRADFFIDYVDIEYALRLRRAGYRLLLAAGTRINHRLGEPKQIQFFGKSRTFNSHGPGRRYYIYRNRVRVWRAYMRSMPAYILADILGALKGLLVDARREQNSLEHLRAMLRGFVDGFRD